jgi:hypothetical protein
MVDPIIIADRESFHCMCSNFGWYLRIKNGKLHKYRIASTVIQLGLLYPVYDIYMDINYATKCRYLQFGTLCKNMFFVACA